MRNTKQKEPTKLNYSYCRTTDDYAIHYIVYIIYMAVAAAAATGAGSQASLSPRQTPNRIRNEVFKYDSTRQCNKIIAFHLNLVYKFCARMHPTTSGCMTLVPLVRVCVKETRQCIHSFNAHIGMVCAVCSSSYKTTNAIIFGETCNRTKPTAIHTHTDVVVVDDHNMTIIH